jgi:hypothetical protein
MRRSLQKIAGPSGSPVALSQSKQLPRWLVSPTAATCARSCALDSSASASSSAAQICSAFCSCQSGAGVLRSICCALAATAAPSRPKSVQRTENEPASIARISGVSCI